jgi:hypothetical protein
MLVNFIFHISLSGQVLEETLFLYHWSMAYLQLAMVILIIISAIGFLVLSVIRKDEYELVDWDTNTSYLNAFFYYPTFMVKSWELEKTKSVTAWCLALSILISIFILSNGYLAFILYFPIFGMIYTLWTARKNRKIDN